MDELHTLRVSVARIAQLIDLEKAIPGAAGRTGMPYEQLVACATQHPRGWNTLCGRIANWIEAQSLEMQRRATALEEGLPPLRKRLEDLEVNLADLVTTLRS